MANLIVICDSCEAENQDWEDHSGTHWFTCTECGFDNEQVYDRSK
jgi:hypothetical protein